MHLCGVSAAALGVMQRHVLRWLAIPAGIAVACAAGLWLYFETAFSIGVSASLKCLFSTKAADSCTTHFVDFRFWSWAVVSSALSGLVSVLLAVVAAPRQRDKVRLCATLIPPICWLWFFDWDLSDSTAVVLVASAFVGGFLAWPILPRLLARMTPDTSLERTREK